MEQHTLLEKFFKNALQDIYYAEEQLLKALERMEREATTGELKLVFRHQMAETEDHIDRLTMVFTSIGEEARAKRCEAIEGIIRETDTIIGETKEDTYTRDIALVFTAQKAEFYQIAAYSGLIDLAEQLELDTVANLLALSLEEERDAVIMLADIAQNYLYEAAIAE